MENLLNKEGVPFTADIEGLPCKGVIRVEGKEVFLCQNQADGSSCSNRQGYKYSWVVGKGSESELTFNAVTNLTLLESEEEKISIFDERNHGKYFVAEIRGTLVQGRISIEKNGCFLCQNDFAGTSANNKFGFKYSWIINPKHENPFAANNVFNLHVYDSSEECGLYLKEAREKKLKIEENFKTATNLHDKWFTANINGLLVYGKICVCNEKQIHLYQNFEGMFADKPYYKEFKYFVEVDLTKGSGSPLEYVGFSDLQIFDSNCVQAYERMKSMPKYYIHTNSKAPSFKETYIDPQCLLNTVNHGKYYVAKIKDMPTWGRIFVDSCNTYLCQNFRDGAYTSNKLGFKYSWMVNSDSSDPSKVIGIKDLLIFDDITGIKEAFKNIGGENFDDYAPKTVYVNTTTTETKTFVEVDLKPCKIETVSLKEMVCCTSDPKIDKLSNISKNSKTKKLFNI